MWNNRIEKSIRGSCEGITVAGSSKGTEGHDAETLDFPNDVIIDDETNVVYVIDTSNNRVQRCKLFASKGDTIVGDMGMFILFIFTIRFSIRCFFFITGAGNATNQLNKPVDLAFDIKGNLYVMDMENNRVQMFELIDNRPCCMKINK
jgi:sugar lactone lactonase YvrE